MRTKVSQKRKETSFLLLVGKSITEFVDVALGMFMTTVVIGVIEKALKLTYDGKEAFSRGVFSPRDGFPRKVLRGKKALYMRKGRFLYEVDANARRGCCAILNGLAWFFCCLLVCFDAGNEEKMAVYGGGLCRSDRFSHDVSDLVEKKPGAFVRDGKFLGEVNSGNAVVLAEENYGLQPMSEGEVAFAKDGDAFEGELFSTTGALVNATGRDAVGLVLAARAGWIT